MSGSILLVSDPFAPAQNAGGAFAGLPPATLQLYLQQAQQALHSLAMGRNSVTVSYAEGSGQKSVTYQRTDQAQLRQHIAELKSLLGMGCGRRALRVRI